MNPTPHPRISSLAWLLVTTPNQQPFWARTSHVLSTLSQAGKHKTMKLLKDGKSILDEQSAMQMQCVPMTVGILRRLDYLLSLEAGGFRLTSFQPKAAVYTRERMVCISMQELIDRGYLPKAFIAVNRANVAITSPIGKLLDVFVPVADMKLNFTLR